MEENNSTYKWSKNVFSTMRNEVKYTIKYTVIVNILLIVCFYTSSTVLTNKSYTSIGRIILGYIGSHPVN